MTDNDEDQLSIEVARAIIIQAIEDGLVIDDLLVEQASAKVHAAWIERHPNPDNPNDLRPYSDLEESEKEKDRVFVHRAIAELTAAAI